MTGVRPLPRPRLEEIEAAARRIEGKVLRTPLVPLNVESSQIFLKLENLQPIGSFKLRGATNALELADREALQKGVFTASAGNMAQGLAWSAARLGIECTVVVPDHAPRTKVEAAERLGARVIEVPFDIWWQVLVEHHYEGLEGVFVHPVSDPAVVAGNGTIGLELFEDLPDLATVIVPYGGGGLSCGIASALKSLKPDVRVMAAEVTSAAPLSAAFAAGERRSVSYQPTFVDGIGGKNVLQEMWPLVAEVLDGAHASSPVEIAGAVRLLVERNRVVAEGAGAASVAAALGGEWEPPVVCVVSGGNLDAAKLAAILAGEVPG